MANETMKDLSTQFDLGEVIETSIKIPGVKVNRNAFLAEQFAKNDIDIQEIIEKGPVEAGCAREELTKKAEALILTRTSLSSIASFIAGIPGGWAMAATIPADLLQFFAVALRLAQELSYLYGAKDLFVDGEVDDERVRSQLVMYCGVMFGVSGAVNGVRVLSTQIAKTAGKKIPQKALTKTLWYPIVKKIGRAIGVNITKKTVGNAVEKVVPVIGGVISGTINFATMMPMSKKLWKTLDKAAFDYSDEELEEDIDIIERIAKGEDIKEDVKKVNDIKEKVNSSLKTVGDKAKGFVDKVSKKVEEKEKERAKRKIDPVEEIKKYKELLDLGIISQEEFDTKKKELLGI